MVKFAHMADVHLGGWKQQPLRELNFKSFQKAVDTCILEKVDFVLIAGDLFDSSFPSIDILKQTFAEFKKLNESRIPCFIIAGSHDYSVSGKTFLDVPYGAETAILLQLLLYLFSRNPHYKNSA